MAIDVFTIDGVSFPTIHVISLKRKFAIADGPLSGRNLHGEMIRDVIGTYYNYSLQLACDTMSREEYDNFYDLISDPVESRSIVVPYGQATLTFDAYITSGEDELTLMTENGNFWKGITCDFVAMKPKKRPLA